MRDRRKWTFDIFFLSNLQEFEMGQLQKQTLSALGALVAIMTVATLVRPSDGNAQPATQAAVPAGTYVLDPNHASLIWSVNHLGLAQYRGRFKALSGQLEFDPAKPEASKIEAVIEVNSIQTAYAGTDKSFEQELTSSMVLDGATYPTIAFKSVKIVTTGTNTGKVTGNLTFHGVTKPVTLDVTFNGGLSRHPMTQKAAIGFTAKGAIKRSEFGIGFLQGIVGDEVEILIDAEFQKPT
jgi:polyisoprenoid-binding protein YceI